MTNAGAQSVSHHLTLNIKAVYFSIIYSIYVSIYLSSSYFILTAGPAVSHGVRSTPGPLDGPLLSHSPVSFTVEQSHSLSTVPALMLQDQADEKQADFSTTETLRTQMENSTSDLHMVNMSTSPTANASVVFGGDDAASINVTERTPLDFLNVTMNAEPAFFEAPTTAKPLESSAEPQYQQVTTSSGDQDHQEQLKSIW